MGGKVKQIKSTIEAESQWQEFKRNSSQYKLLLWSVGVFLGVSIFVFFVFVFAHPWNFTCRADSEQWGQYGDFIGGFLGTLVAFISIYYLVGPLKAQKEANDKLQASNDEASNINTLQQTDIKIRHLLEYYNDIRESYPKSTKGQPLKEIVDQLSEEHIHTDANYSTRLAQAKEVFDSQFYIKKRSIAAVQFRVLYQIMCLITSIDESKNRDAKVFYGKLVRSQLGEDELLLLRYNCWCKYGEAMRQHINRFNLLKHLPALSLLEFQYWVKIILTNDVLRNAVDTELIAQRKLIREVTDSRETELNRHLIISAKYSLDVTFSPDRKNFTYCLIRKDDMPDVEHIDESFGVLGNDHMLHFLLDYLHEVFEYSNFQMYNNELSYRQELSNDPDRCETYFKVTIQSENEIVMNYTDYLARNPEKNIPAPKIENNIE